MLTPKQEDQESDSGNLELENQIDDTKPDEREPRPPREAQVSKQNNNKEKLTLKSLELLPYNVQAPLERQLLLRRVPVEFPMSSNVMEGPKTKAALYEALRDHPFKTSACLRGEGCPHVPMVQRSQYMRIKNPLHMNFAGTPMVGG